MASAHGNKSDQKEFFMKGYNEMLKRLEPETIICYHYPFEEMCGNILFVDYDLSSWQHYEDDEVELPYTQSEKYLLGIEKPYAESNIVVKSNRYVISEKGKRQRISFYVAYNSAQLCILYPGRFVCRQNPRNRNVNDTENMCVCMDCIYRIQRYEKMQQIKDSSEKGTDGQAPVCSF